MGTGIMCREADTSVPVPMCVAKVLSGYGGIYLLSLVDSQQLVDYTCNDYRLTAEC